MIKGVYSTDAQRSIKFTEVSVNQSKYTKGGKYSSNNNKYMLFGSHTAYDRTNKCIFDNCIFHNLYYYFLLYSADYEESLKFETKIY